MSLHPMPSLHTRGDYFQVSPSLVRKKRFLWGFWCLQWLYWFIDLPEQTMGHWMPLTGWHDFIKRGPSLWKNATFTQRVTPDPSTCLLTDKALRAPTLILHVCGLNGDRNKDLNNHFKSQDSTCLPQARFSHWKLSFKTIVTRWW